MISIPRLVATVLATTGVSPARAQSLGDFLHDVIAGNPRIIAATAAATAAREEIAVARGAGRPSLGLDGQLNRMQQADAVLRTNPTMRDSNGRAVLGIPLYSGGEVRYGIAAARWRARAAEADRRQAIQDVLVETVEAYAGLARDEVVVDLHRAHVAMLGEERRRVQAEIHAAQATRTDLFQTEARLAGAHADLAGADAQRIGSLETLRALAGRYPAGRVDPPDMLEQEALLPAALAIGDEASTDAADLVSAGDRLAAARADIGVARSGRLPRLSLDTSATYGFNIFRNGRFLLPDDPGRFATRGAQVALNLRIPLSQGGAVGARVRRSEAAAAEAIEVRTGTQRLALSRLRRDRVRLAANRASVAALETAVRRNGEAVHGVRIDRRLGFRTTLEVLNAEQELLDSRIRLASLRAALVNGAAALLRDVGRGGELADVFPPSRSGQKAAAAPASLAQKAGASTMMLTSFDLADLPGSRVTGTGRLGYDRAVADLPGAGNDGSGCRAETLHQRLRYQLV
jgi:outer membrane protein